MTQAIPGLPGNATPPVAGRRSWARVPRVWLAVGAVASWWVGSFALGLPGPNVDDLFFVGPALELHQRGILGNQLIGHWLAQFGTDRYLVQPPFHPYALAGWLQVFGVSAVSLIGFQNLCGALASLGLVVVSRRGGLGWLASVSLALLVPAYLLRTGMRPDMLGLVLLVAAALGWSSRSGAGWILGSLAGAAAPLVHPFAAAAAVSLWCWFLWRRRIAANASGATVPRAAAGVWLVAASAASVAVVLLLAAAAVDDFAEFVRVFRAHAAMKGSGLANVAGSIRAASVGLEPVLRWPVVCVFLAGCVGGIAIAESRRAVTAIAVLFGGVCLTQALLYPGYFVRVVFLEAVIAGAFLCRTLVGARLRTAFGVGVALAAGVMVSTDAFGLFMQRRADIDPGEIRAVVEHARQPGSRLLLDEYAARYVYDWKLPPGSEDWLHSYWLPKSETTPGRGKSSSDVWVVDARALESHVPDLGIRSERLRIFGRPLSMSARSGDLRIVR